MIQGKYGSSHRDARISYLGRVEVEGESVACRAIYDGKMSSQENFLPGLVEFNRVAGVWLQHRCHARVLSFFLIDLSSDICSDFHKRQ